MLGKNEKGKADVFAQIAQQGMNFGGKDLIVPTPPENNNVILPLYSDESGKRVYPDKMSTEVRSHYFRLFFSRKVMSDSLRPRGR